MCFTSPLSTFSSPLSTFSSPLSTFTCHPSVYPVLSAHSHAIPVFTLSSQHIHMPSQCLPCPLSTFTCHPSVYPVLSAHSHAIPVFTLSSQHIHMPSQCLPCWCVRHSNRSSCVLVFEFRFPRYSAQPPQHSHLTRLCHCFLSLCWCLDIPSHLGCPLQPYHHLLADIT